MQRRREPLGVLGLGADEIGDGLKEIAGPLASILGAAVLESERYSDTLQIVRGARQMELAAALQWSILPLPSYADGTVEISGRLEPAYDIGGDAFDLGVNEGQVELAIFDAMGHGLQAALLSHLAVGAYRFARRRRGDLAQIASEADQAVSVFGGGERFVTSTMCRISIPNGVLQWINAGHPPPMLVRGGAAESLDGQPMLPLGLGGSPTPVGQMSLEPGDVVVLHSDGIIEARSAHGESYGIQRFVETKLGHLAADPNLTNLTRRVLDAVLEHVGRDLQDDATLVAMRWMGPPGTA